MKAVHRVRVSAIIDGIRQTEVNDYARERDAIGAYRKNHDRLHDELIDTAKQEEGRLKIVYTYGIGWERTDFTLSGTNFDQHAWCEIANVLAN